MQLAAASCQRHAYFFFVTGDVYRWNRTEPFQRAVERGEGGEGERPPGPIWFAPLQSEGFFGQLGDTASGTTLGKYILRMYLCRKIFNKGTSVAPEVSGVDKEGICGSNVGVHPSKNLANIGQAAIWPEFGFSHSGSAEQMCSNLSLVVETHIELDHILPLRCLHFFVLGVN